MKAIIITLVILFLQHRAIAQDCSCDSICYCQNLIEKITNNWNRFILNSDSVKLISIKEVGTIETEDNKRKYIELLTADTAWVAHPTIAKKCYVELLRYDSVQGKNINFYDSSHKLIRSYQSFAKKEDALMYLNRSIKLTDKYYEIFFQINGKTIMSPTICKTKHYTCVGFLDNIISNLSYELVH